MCLLNYIVGDPSHLCYKEGAKVNANSYIKGILTPALVEMKRHFRDEVSTFQ